MKKWGIFSVVLIMFAGSIIYSATVATYEQDIKPVLTSNCVSCHSWTGDYTQLVEKTSAENETSGKFMVVAEQPDESVLIWRLEGKLPDGNSITRMPKFSAPLSDGNIRLTSQWIEQGALDSAVGIEEESNSWGTVKKLYR